MFVYSDVFRLPIHNVTVGNILIAVLTSQFGDDQTHMVRFLLNTPLCESGVWDVISEFYSLWFGDAIWLHIYGLRLVQVLACHISGTNQCWKLSVEPQVTKLEETWKMHIIWMCSLQNDDYFGWVPMCISILCSIFVNYVSVISCYDFLMKRLHIISMLVNSFILQCFQASTQWPLFCWHFQINFLEWNVSVLLPMMQFTDTSMC